MAKEKVIRRRKTIQWLKKKLSEDVRQYNGQSKTIQWPKTKLSEDVRQYNGQRKRYQKM